MKSWSHLRCWLIVFFIPLLASVVLGQETPILFDHLTIADGLSEGTTLAMVQDEQGFMWFATQYCKR